MDEAAVDPQTPKAICLLLCERVISDSKNGCTSIINIYRNAAPNRYPMNFQRLVAFAMIANVRTLAVGLRIVRDEDDREIMKSPPTATAIGDPNRVAELTCDLSTVIFPTAGHYTLQATVGDVAIGWWRFQLV